MATTKDYKNFILEQLSLLDNITCKQIMEKVFQSVIQKKMKHINIKF